MGQASGGGNYRAIATVGALIEVTILIGSLKTSAPKGLYLVEETD